MLPNWFFVTIYATLGVAIGSFLNVVIARVPKKESLNTRSKCPQCGYQIRAYDNIPLLSWLILKGKCRHCSSHISTRYPFVEALTGFGYLMLATHFHMRTPSPLEIALLIALPITIALAFIDIDTQRLPDSLTLPLLLITGTLLIGESTLTGDWENLKTAAISGTAYTAFYFALWFSTQGRGLGFGDVKLAPSLGLLVGWFGYESAATGFVAAFIIGGIPLGLLMLTGKLKRGTPVPFGPFLIAGAWVGIFYGTDIANAYLTLVGLR